MASYTFNPGDGATYSINGDSYPYTVRKVSESGKTVWASEDDFKGKPGANSLYETDDYEGVFVPRDLPEDKWVKFTLRRDGSWRKVGTNYVFLSKGRRFRRDPSF